MKTAEGSGPRARAEKRAAGAILALLVALLLVRLAAMALLPLMDTTEARYADIARRMADSGDWVTPWHDDGAPFWGKPPLSFWLTAASFKLLGMSEFAARLPHLLCTAGVVALVAWLARRSAGEALLSVALLFGSLGLYVGGAGVMTDPALMLGTTLAMAGFWVALHGEEGPQRRLGGWALFGGLAIGLLAKGPIVLVLVGPPLLLWALASRRAAHAWRALPWLGGLLVTTLLVAPWYLAAEHRTPGFLNYFLLGEHWHRFVTPGWAGDLYGFAHRRAPGTIWLYALLAVLPWPLLALLLRRPAGQEPPDDTTVLWQRYLLLWTLWPLIFFTAARNIIWPYVLPSLPAAALLGAGWLAARERQRVLRWVAGGLALTAVACAVALGTGLYRGRFDQESARPVVRAWQHLRQRGEPLLFVGRRPFSASFYGDGAPLQVADAAAAAQRIGRGGAFVAMAGGTAAQPLRDALGGRELLKAGRFGAFDLIVVEPASDRVAQPAAASTDTARETKP